MDHDGEIQLAFKQLAEVRKQLEAAGEFRRLKELHQALGIMGATVLGSMIQAQYGKEE